VSGSVAETKSRTRKRGGQFNGVAACALHAGQGDRHAGFPVCRLRLSLDSADRIEETDYDRVSIRRGVFTLEVASHFRLACIEARGC
jgi:hypothetical protein